MIAYILILAAFCYIAYTAGRQKGFEECWKEWVKRDEKVHNDCDNSVNNADGGSDIQTGPQD